MPAKNLYREDKEGIYSHIYNKGIEKRIIFSGEEDYEVFQGFLKDYLTPPQDPESIKKEFSVHGRIFRGTPHQPKNYFNKVELAAYSLMPNHFHLLLHQKTLGSMESFIRSLCTRYSMYFNKKYQHSGALFEGPYKSNQIKDKIRMLYLTRYLHHDGGHSSYAEYLGTRVTSWVKPEVVQSFFEKVKPDLSKETHSYKDFVEKYEPGEKKGELIEDMTLESETQHLERRDPASNVESHNPDKPLPRTPELLTAGVVFLLLLTLGLRNIMISETKSLIPVTTPLVLSETKKVEDVKPKVEDVKPKIILTVKADDGVENVNIRQKPTTNSEKIGQAKGGDIFEFVSEDSGWYEVKLATGSGFISSAYIRTGETDK